MKILTIYILCLFTVSCIRANEKVDSNKMNSEKIIQKTQQDSSFYWEALNEDQKAEILKSKEINRTAIDFYHGKIKVGDNNITINLLDTITSFHNSKAISSFYFFLFNKICNTADGALSEILGSYCQRVILNSPSYVIDYFSRNDKIMRKYAELLGYELYFKEDGTSEIEYGYSDFKKILSGKLENKEKYNNILKRFYKEIEISMNSMN